MRQLAALAANQGPDIQIVADRRGVIHYASSAAERILGIDPRTHRNAHVLHFVHSEDVESAVAVLEGLLRRGGRAPAGPGAAAGSR